MSRDRIYKLAIDRYGERLQKIVAIEEMTELTQAITKDLRGSRNINNIMEEMADVIIMIEQLQIIYSVPDILLNEYVELKLERLQERMK